MKLSHVQTLFSIAFLYLQIAVEATPRLLLVSDSTATDFVPGDEHAGYPYVQGWGHFLHLFFTVPVLNLSQRGRSVRSFIEVGFWAEVLAIIQPGDFVVIQFGHNDEGDPVCETDDIAVLPGISNDSMVVMSTSGARERAWPYGWYLRKMIEDVRAKGAEPVMSGMVPIMLWHGNKLEPWWPFRDWAKEVATESGTDFVDHTKYALMRWEMLGPATTKTYYPMDQIHTTPEGAVINAGAFANAVKCGHAKLKKYVIGLADCQEHWEPDTV